MKNENDNIEEVIITVDTDRGKMDCVVINVFEIGDRAYIALMPKDTDEILIFRYRELNDDSIEISGIEDDKEFSEALDKFDSLMIDIQDE